LILALISLWLLVNLFKETFKEKRPIDFFDYFFFIFSRYFDYFIIILLFSVNNQLDFALIVIKRDFNINDRL